MGDAAELGVEELGGAHAPDDEDDHTPDHATNHATDHTLGSERCQVLASRSDFIVRARAGLTKAGGLRLLGLGTDRRFHVANDSQRHRKCEIHCSLGRRIE